MFPWFLSFCCHVVALRYYDLGSSAPDRVWYLFDFAIIFLQIGQSDVVAFLFLACQLSWQILGRHMVYAEAEDGKELHVKVGTHTPTFILLILWELLTLSLSFAAAAHCWTLDFMAFICSLFISAILLVDVTSTIVIFYLVRVGRLPDFVEKLTAQDVARKFDSKKTWHIGVVTTFVMRPRLRAHDGNGGDDDGLGLTTEQIMLEDDDTMT